MARLVAAVRNYFCCDHLDLIPKTAVLRLGKFRIGNLGKHYRGPEKSEELTSCRRRAILLKLEGKGMNLETVYRLYCKERLTVRKRGGRAMAPS